MVGVAAMGVVFQAEVVVGRVGGGETADRRLQTTDQGGGSFQSENDYGRRLRITREIVHPNRRPILLQKNQSWQEPLWFNLRLTFP